MCAEDDKVGADHMGGLRCRLGCVEAGGPRRRGLASATRVRVWAAASGRVRSRVLMGGDRVGRRLGGAYAPLWTSLNFALDEAGAARARQATYRGHLASMGQILAL